ncbi:MAG TPA: DNA translocase FtsK [Candidatus Woesebacteria bacterium]|nr:DNA translocase FtsK [Candidatus Woesebacteria bacterium]
MSRGRKKKSLLPSLKLKPSTIQSIFFVFFVIVALISIFSFLQIGPIPTQYNQILTSLFGLLSVFVPFLLVLIALLFAKIKSPLKEPNVFLGFLVMFVSASSITRQGSFGQFIWDQVFSLFNLVPTFLIFSFSLIVGFVVLFDTSVVQIIKFFVQVFNTIRKYTIGNTSFKLKPLAKSQKTKETIFSSPDEITHNEAPTPKASTKDDYVVGVAPVMKVENIDRPINSGIPANENKIWQYPPISLFDGTPGAKADRGDVRKNAQIIERTLESFGITARVAEVNDSPSVTQYALEVALGTKLAKIISLSNDLAMALSAPGGQIRVEAPIPGRPLVGIEVPNHSLQVVPLRQILESEVMKNAKSKLTVPLGLDVAGKPRVADIAKMPHVIIAGQTGSGKSVCVNSWINTLLFRASPEEVRMIMVDPKRVELTPYNGIPHLLNPVIVEPEKVVSALKWAVGEMERRYKMFTEVNAKNIESYNNLAGFQAVPYIVIVIDELAEIMLFSPAEVEDNICRLAQMARAVGIHLVLATQRPSVNIITGLIKANVPTRIAFAVASMTDSRVVLDTPGAEKLLGRGDMLFVPPDLAKPVRIQGTFVADKDINHLIDFLKTQRQADYNTEVTSVPIASKNTLSPNVVSVNGEDHDALFNDAVKFIVDTGKASATYLQRHLKVGYARAARLLDEMEQAGIVGPVNGSKPREIKIPHKGSEI